MSDDEAGNRLVLVKLPRFRIEHKLDLTPALKALGLRDALDAVAADFSGINGDRHGFFIAAVLHKTFIEVEEKGTEAAAATATVLDPTSAGMPMERPKPILFQADRPFLYFVVERATQAVLFAGRVGNPASLKPLGPSLSSEGVGFDEPMPAEGTEHTSEKVGLLGRVKRWLFTPQ